MSKTQNYELAFHLNPNLETSKVQQIKQEVETMISSNSGAVSYSKNPEKTRLSYPLEHHGSSLFGYFQFQMPSPETLLRLTETMKLNSDILRYLLIKMPSDLQKKQSMLKQIKTRERMERKTKPKESAVPAPENKELDKQLEDVIGNL